MFLKGAPRKKNDFRPLRYVEKHFYVSLKKSQSVYLKKIKSRETII